MPEESTPSKPKNKLWSAIFQYLFRLLFSTTYDSTPPIPKRTLKSKSPYLANGKFSRENIERSQRTTESKSPYLANGKFSFENVERLENGE